MEYLSLFSEVENIWKKRDLRSFFDFLEKEKDKFIGRYDDLGSLYFLSRFLVENNVPDAECTLLFSPTSLSDVIKNIKRLRRAVQRLNWCEEFSLEEFLQCFFESSAGSEELTWIVFSSAVDTDYVLGRISNTVEARKSSPQIDYYRDSLSAEGNVSFIVCTNDEEEIEESSYYIKRLYLPENCSLDILKVYDAKSICSGYNEGMNSSRSKYKIYMHQDVRIIDRYFLYYLLHIFSENPEIGIMGMVGAEDFSSDGYVWHSPLSGSWIEGKVDAASLYRSDMTSLKKVMLLDGFLLATQYDIPWREDIFDGFHFYDASECMEFKKAGYQAAVPYQKNPWCLHECGWSNTGNYLHYSDIFKKEYSDYL
ncbi:MAG: glycosyltransferase family protein [Lachnospiraceae bacterium]|nr:glycosyltransferase family protein [Lachnospiraceae bacterium]